MQGAYHTGFGLVMLPASVLFGALYKCWAHWLLLGRVWHWLCWRYHFFRHRPPLVHDERD